MISEALSLHLLNRVNEAPLQSLPSAALASLSAGLASLGCRKHRRRLEVPSAGAASSQGNPDSKVQPRFGLLKDQNVAWRKLLAAFLVFVFFLSVPCSYRKFATSGT